MAWEKHVRTGKKSGQDPMIKIRSDGAFSINTAARRLIGSERMNIFFDAEGPRIGFEGAQEDGTNKCAAHWVSSIHRWMKEHVELPSKGGLIEVPVYEEDGRVVAMLCPRKGKGG